MSVVLLSVEQKFQVSLQLKSKPLLITLYITNSSKCFCGKLALRTEALFFSLEDYRGNSVLQATARNLDHFLLTIK